MTNYFGKPYMNPRKREEIVGIAFNTVLTILQDADYDDYERVRQAKNAIWEYQRFIAFHEKEDKRLERRRQAGINN